MTPKTQIVLALKYVANLKVENIALQFGAEPDAIEKLLYRARQKIKSESLVLSTSLYGYSMERLSVMHKVIYLIFNEGYKQSGDKISQGKIMCEDALMEYQDRALGPIINTACRLFINRIRRFYLFTLPP